MVLTITRNQFTVAINDVYYTILDDPTEDLNAVNASVCVTVAGSIGKTLLDAPTAILYHWNMIQSHDKQNHRELMLTPLLFTSYDIIYNHQNLFK